MLIRAAELLSGEIVDLRIEAGQIAAIGTLSARADEPVIEAGGGLLLPGLHDHHIHLPALAASLESVSCGPPQVFDEADLRAALQAPGEGWLRGTGYHESVAGMLTAAQLDRINADRPYWLRHRVICEAGFQCRHGQCGRCGR